jgi:hypothetical protein
MLNIALPVLLDTFLMRSDASKSKIVEFAITGISLDVLSDVTATQREANTNTTTKMQLTICR